MTPDAFLSLAVVLIVVGILLWIANRFLPMDERIRQLLNMVVTIGAALYVCYVLLSMIGVL